MHVNILFQIAFAGVVFGWEHISSNELSGILSEENVDALVACECFNTRPIHEIKIQFAKSANFVYRIRKLTIHHSCGSTQSPIIKRTRIINANYSFAL